MSRWDDETWSRTVGFTEFVIKDLSRAKTPNCKLWGFDNCGKISEQQWSAVSVDLKDLVRAAACQGHCRSCWTVLHWHPCCVDAVELKWMRGCVSFFLTKNKCHFLSHGLTCSVFPPPPSVLPSCFDPPNPPPLSSLPFYLLPPLAVAFCQSAYPPGRGGVFDPSLFESPSLLSLWAWASFQRAALCRFAALIHEQSPLLTVKPEFKDDIRWLYSGLSVRTCCSRKKENEKTQQKTTMCDEWHQRARRSWCRVGSLTTDHHHVTIDMLRPLLGGWWAEFCLIRWWIVFSYPPVNHPLYLTVSCCHLSLESASPLSLLYLFTFSACSSLFSSLFRAFRHVFQ